MVMPRFVTSVVRQDFGWYENPYGDVWLISLGTFYSTEHDLNYSVVDLSLLVFKGGS